MRAGHASSPRPGGTRQSTRARPRAGITLILSEAWIMRRRERHAEHRLESTARRRVDAGRSARARRAGRPGPRPSAARKPRPPRSRSKPGLRPAEALEQRRELQQRVVADARAARRARPCPSCVEAEAERRPSRRSRRRSRRRPPKGRTRAGALVEQVVAADLVGVVLADPLGAERAADLLVDDADDEQVAARRPPALRASDGRGDGLGRGLGLHVQRAAAPQERRRRRRPTTGRAASPRGRRARCRRARAGTGSGRRRSPRSRATRFGRSGSAAEQLDLEARRRAGTPASHSWRARSLPGGLTVLSGSAPGGRGRSRPAGRAHRPEARQARDTARVWTTAVRAARGRAARRHGARPARRWPRGCGPRTLDEVVGQEHLLGRGPRAAHGDRGGPAALDGPLRAARDRQDDAGADRGRGPPTRAFEELSRGAGGPRGGARGASSGPTSGARAGAGTIFFLDEIHRFNKAQQDALLPAVEEGLVTLIGATTENPYFEVNSALLSRAQVYELHAARPPTRGARRSSSGRGSRPTTRRSTSSPTARAATRGRRWRARDRRATPAGA